MSKRPFLGIVVPVFNTEDRYLLDCLASLNQQCDDYQVIVVDDGSQEHTAAVCKKFVAFHQQKFAYLRQSNRGQNAARNAGRQWLNAQYTCFVDSDDLLAKGAITLLCQLLAESHTDIVFYRWKIVGESVDSYLLPCCVRSTEEFCREMTKKQLLSERNSVCLCAINTFLLHRYPFVTGFHIGEDFSSLFPIIAASKAWKYLDLPLYAYRSRPTSATHNSNYKYPLEIIQAFEHIKQTGLNKKWSDEIEWMAIKHLLYWEPLRLYRSHQMTKQTKQRLFGYVNENFPNWKKNSYLREQYRQYGPSFRLLVSGNWSLYKIAKAVEHILLKRY